MARKLPKQVIMKEAKDEIQEIIAEREADEQRKLQAEAEYAEAYAEDFRREQQEELEKFIHEGEVNNSFFVEEE
jgi:hypothetical protein